MTIHITEERYTQMSDDMGGFCLACGEEAFSVEPDARNYVCESCGQPEVFGVEELLMSGEVEFADGSE